MNGLTARRSAALAQAATGMVLLVRPDGLVTLVCGDGARPATWIVRVLGARMAGQGCALAARPARSLVLAGAAADLVHALSMLWVTRQTPQYRRPAQASALAATLFAAASTAAASTSAGPSDQHR